VTVIDVGTIAPLTHREAMLLQKPEPERALAPLGTLDDRE
jgi:hypothetical protein